MNLENVRLQTIFENLGVAIAHVGLDGRFCQVNPKMCQLTGYTETELLGKTFQDLTYEPDLKLSLEWLSKFKSGQLNHIKAEKRYRHKDGNLIHIHLLISAVRGEDGALQGFASAFEDITERVRMDRLHQSQRNVLEMIANNQPLHRTLESIVHLIEEQAPGSRSTIYLLDAEGKLRIGAAPSFPEDFLKAVDGAVAGPETGSCGEAAFFGKPVNSSDIAKDPYWGVYREWALGYGLRAAWSHPVISTAGKVLGTVSMCWPAPRVPAQHELDVLNAATRLMSLVIERDKREELIRQQRMKLDSSAELEETLSVLKATLESTTDGILVVPHGRRMVRFNMKFMQIWNLPPDCMEDDRAVDLAAQRVKDPAAFTARILSVNASDEPSYDRMEFRDGRIVERFSLPLLIGGVMKGRVWSFRDITETTRLEAQLRISDRMASVGRLAAGVAHEINNPLAHVVSSLEMAQEKLQVGEPLELARAAHESAIRIARIVRDLKALSRPDQDVIIAVNPCEALDTAANMVQNQLRRARIIRDYQETPLVRATEGRLNQVFLNLLINAAHAIPERPPELNTIHLLVRPAPNDKVLIEIHDNGEGMDENTKRHLFDPFYTTKPVGTGTGLGLSICYGIVQSLGGEIEVESARGQGTRVRITLPQALPEYSPRAPEPAPPHAAAGAQKRGRILIIDDEEIIGFSLGKILSDRHEVVVTKSAREGLSLLLSSGDRFDLCFCDLMMPELTGADIYEQVQREAPGLESRFVFLTGGAFTDRTEAFVRSVKNPVIDKPFRMSEIRELADRLIAGVELSRTPSR